MRQTESAQTWGIALLRMMVGTVFLMHGGQKLFVYGRNGVAGTFGQMGIPFPMLSATLASSAEFFGGAALLLGLFTRWASIPLIATMAVAVLGVHLRAGFFLPNGYEFALTLLVANIALALSGSGAFALDNLLARRRSGTPLPEGKARLQAVSQ